MEHMLTTMNWLGVALSVLAVFVIGGPWYGPIFGKAYHAAGGTNPATMKKPHPAKVFGGAAVAGLLAALVISMFAGHHPSLDRGLSTGFHFGLAVFMAFAINYLFAQRTMKLLAIDGAYNLVLFTAMGAIFGALG